MIADQVRNDGENQVRNDGEDQVRNGGEDQVDAQKGESLQEVYEWLSINLGEIQTTTSMEQGYKNIADDVEREQRASEWIEDTLNTEEL